jgi:malonyl-CoA O-methyltransferase
MPLDKSRIRLSFSAASATYDPAANLQRSVGYALLNTVDANITGTLLDIGCGTGFLTGELMRFNPELLIALDIALPMLQATRDKFVSRGSQSLSQLALICADAEALPLASHSVNHVFSSLALQWCSNLSAVFCHIKRILKPDGQLIFSTFAPQTLQELKTAWASVDAYSHVNDFDDAAQLEQFLRDAGFINIAITRTLYTRYYDSVLALMQELKHIGAHNVRTERNKHCTGKTAMQRMIAAYETAHSVDGKISASFEVFMVVAS